MNHSSNRQPLSNLPLEHFSRPDIAANPFKVSKSVKRSLPPELSKFTPSKRRILHEEKQAPSSFGHRLPTQASVQPTGCTPQLSRTSISDALPSISSVSRSQRTSFGLENAITAKECPHAETDVVSEKADVEREEDTFVPREPLPPQDPDSIHYPGFVIHTDSYIVIPGKSKNVDYGTAEKDKHKENMPIRLSLTKTNKTGVFTPSKLDFSSKVSVRDIPMSSPQRPPVKSSPRKLGLRSEHAISDFPMASPHKPSLMGAIKIQQQHVSPSLRAHRRHALEAEMNSTIMEIEEP